MALSTIEEIQKEPTKLYLDRINELNEIIGQLNKENETLKMNLNVERQNIKFYKICRPRGQIEHFMCLNNNRGLIPLTA